MLTTTTSCPSVFPSRLSGLTSPRSLACHQHSLSLSLSVSVAVCVSFSVLPHFLQPPAPSLSPFLSSESHSIFEPGCQTSLGLGAGHGCGKRSSGMWLCLVPDRRVKMEPTLRYKQVSGQRWSLGNGGGAKGPGSGISSGSENFHFFQKLK